MTQTRTSVLLLCLPLLLAACARHYTAPVADPVGGPIYFQTAREHRVNDGETLYVIAWMYGLDVNALAEANGLAPPYTISRDQMLRIDLGRPVTEAVAGASLPPAPPPVSSSVAASSSQAPAASGVTVTPVAVTNTVVRSGLPAAPVAGGTSRVPLPPAPGAPGSQPSSMNTAPVTAGSTPTAGAAAPAPVPPVSGGTSPAAAPLTPPVTASDTAGTVALAEPPRIEPPSAPTATTAEAPAPAASGPIVWTWPAGGPILTRFSESAVDAKGIDIGGSKGDAVLAAADGEVVYAGRGLLRYGDMIILKHDDRFLSAYAHNDRLLVQEGQRVRRGDQIAELGSTGIDRDMLHFEIRVEGKPVDPLSYLPSR